MIATCPACGGRYFKTHLYQKYCPQCTEEKRYRIRRYEEKMYPSSKWS